MRVLADVHRLPLAAASVDLVVSNPPYPGNGVWGERYWEGVGEAVSECRRVLKPHGRGWFLSRNRQGGEQWFTFNRDFCRWAHAGAANLPVATGPGIHWGTVPDEQVAPLIRRWSPPGGTVLDPFAGRGGIPKLAARLGRIPLGFDIDPAQLENGGPY
jgi:tRNA G10  N-methylase Trm11